MNINILKPAVQAYITDHIKDDVSKIALSKPVFEGVSSSELAGQIAAKRKSTHKLPTWYQHKCIYYPSLLSIEQTSSETTAAYKANLATGETLIDLTAGFGIDSFFFAQKMERVISCEINPDLSAISAHNASLLGAANLTCIDQDGIEFLTSYSSSIDTIYLDPARRSGSSKVFKLADCTPDVTKHLPLFFAKAQRVIVKTAPLLDISAGLNELQQVKEIHIVSLKNECKELLWVMDKNHNGDTKIVCATINETVKVFSFNLSAVQTAAQIGDELPAGYLYEPDVALLKSGGFNFIGQHFQLQKLQQHSHLYFSNEVKPAFLGRIFAIEALLSLNELKKEKELVGNVIVRNFPEKADSLVKKYKIKANNDDFIIFTQTVHGYLVIKAKIIQHY
jgi:hypothetical protein